MKAWIVAATALSLAPAGCASVPAGARPDLSAGVVATRSSAVHAFYGRVASFYARLPGRRFNSVVTYRDPVLHDYFRSERAFSDYYADLAQRLADAHFDRDRPIAVDVEEFLAEGPGQARVRVRIVGEDGEPLRWWKTALVREDRWERIEGRWWIIPGRL